MTHRRACSPLASCGCRLCASSPLRQPLPPGELGTGPAATAFLVSSSIAPPHEPPPLPRPTGAELVAKVKARHSEGQLLNADSDADRQLLVGFLLHCADLCNPTLPHDMSVRIAESLGEEFEAQAARERELGHPVSVMLAPTALKKAEMEIGFVQFVVAPLYGLLTKVAPDLVVFLNRVVGHFSRDFLFDTPPPQDAACGSAGKQSIVP